MPRYIDADALPKKRFTDPKKVAKSVGNFLVDFDSGWNAYRDEIDKAPTVSSDEVRGVGEWEEKDVFELESTTIDQMQSARCSVCGKYHTTPFSYYFSKYNYCPSCGAKMEAG